MSKTKNNGKTSEKVAENSINKPSLDEILAHYSDENSALMQLAIAEWNKRSEQKRLSDGSAPVENNALVPLEAKQVQYLNMKIEGVPLRDICSYLNINPAVPALWKQQAGPDSVYAICLDTIDQINADMAEDITRDEAQNNRKANLERMFYVKRWKPEYKDNFQGAGANVVQLNVTIGGQPYVVDATIKEAGHDE